MLTIHIYVRMLLLWVVALNLETGFPRGTL